MIKTEKQSFDWTLTKQRLCAAKLALEQSMVADANKLQEVYRQRARKLAAADQALENKQSTRAALIVTAGNETFAVELQYVERVFPNTPITTIPKSHPDVMGIANFLGQVRLVVDLRRAIGLSVEGETTDGYYILLRRDARRIGLRVDSVQRVQRIASSELDNSHTTTDYVSNYVRTVTRDKLIVLEIPRFFEIGLANTHSPIH